LLDAGPKIGCISVNRPPFVDWFWNAMFEIMRRTRTFLCGADIEAAINASFG
jgi:hypothetical protein